MAQRFDLHSVKKENCNNCKFRVKYAVNVELYKLDVTIKIIHAIRDSYTKEAI